MRGALTAVVLSFGIAGCTGPQLAVTPEAGERIARQCMQEAKAPGTYSLSLKVRGRSFMDRLPKATPVVGLGGTQAGADAINACTLAKAHGGTYEVETVGAGDATVVHYTYGTPPSKTAAPRDREQILADMRREQLGERSFGCTQDAPVLFGGTQYCVKR
jgi:hypothetical protein